MYSSGLFLIHQKFIPGSLNIYKNKANEINSKVDAALNLFSQQVKGGKEFLQSAKGVLVIPNIVKVG